MTGNGKQGKRPAEIPLIDGKTLSRRPRPPLFVSMRSNDVYKGLPHDVFAFTMLQELLARDLNLPLGRYKHAAGSLHLYDTDEGKVRDFLSEAWQDIIEMPPMPNGHPWKAIKSLNAVEEKIRTGKDVNIDSLGLEDYWADFARLLMVYALTKGQSIEANHDKVKALSKAMSFNFFRPYINDRMKRIMATR